MRCNLRGSNLRIKPPESGQEARIHLQARVCIKFQYFLETPLKLSKVWKMDFTIILALQCFWELGARSCNSEINCCFILLLQYPTDLSVVVCEFEEMSLKIMYIYIQFLDLTASAFTLVNSAPCCVSILFTCTVKRKIFVPIHCVCVRVQLGV